MLHQYQIRFLGYKGVVAIDEQLDKRSDGILMRLRPSMRKFDVQDDEMALLEIAQTFQAPNICHLNRSVEELSLMTAIVNTPTVLSS